MTEHWETENEPEPALTPVETAARPPLQGLRRPESGMRLHHLMLLVLGCAVACWALVIAFLALGPAAVVLLVLFAIMVLVAGSVVAFVTLRTQRDALVWALAIAGERGMPLGPALDAVADQCGFFFRKRVHRLAEALNRGAPLPAALGYVPGVLPRDAAVIIRVGWETGTLPAALREAAALRSEHKPAWAGLASRLIYLIAVLLVMQSIMGFILYFIIPKFEAIFKDFGVSLPPLTIAVIQGSHFISKYGFVFVLLILVQLALVVALPFAFAGWLWITVPIVDRLFLRRHSGLILRALSVAIASEKPLPLAFKTLAECYPAHWVRDRLRDVLSDVQRGVEWSAALHAHGLLRKADAALLDAARRSGNLAWALRETAETGERRLSYRLQALLQLVFPLLVLGLGLLVLTIVVAFFSPLLSLIQRLSG